MTTRTTDQDQFVFETVDEPDQTGEDLLVINNGDGSDFQEGEPVVVGRFWNGEDTAPAEDDNEPGLAGVTIYSDLNYNEEYDTSGEFDIII